MLLLFTFSAIVLIVCVYLMFLGTNQGFCIEYKFAVCSLLRVFRSPEFETSKACGLVVDIILADFSVRCSTRFRITSLLGVVLMKR